MPLLQIPLLTTASSQLGWSIASFSNGSEFPLKNFSPKLSQRTEVKRRDNVSHRLTTSIFIRCSTTPAMAAASSAESLANKNASSMHVVICGAGVIGSCTAFFLAQKGVRVTVVEKTGVACAASGKAGGFLALDWSDGGPLGKLARASFELHSKLAAEFDGASYGYRRVDTLSVTVEEDLKSKRRESGGGKKGPAWIDGIAKSIRPIGSTKTCAQVNPELFTKKMLSVAMEKHGAELITGEVQEVKIESDGATSRVKGVVVSGEFIEADKVVIAMGPWSATNQLVSSLTTISPLKAHSIVLRPKKDADLITPHCLFLSYRTQEGKAMDPEIYPRPGGEVYICGMSEEVALPDAAQIKPRQEAISMLQRVATTVSSSFEDAELTHEQACFLPCSEDNLPVIGNIPAVEGAYVATGHSCWGILNAPATGASLAELIADGTSKTVDLKAFDPSRFSKTPLRRRLQVR